MRNTAAGVNLESTNAAAPIGKTCDCSCSRGLLCARKRAELTAKSGSSDVTTEKRALASHFMQRSRSTAQREVPK